MIVFCSTICESLAWGDHVEATEGRCAWCSKPTQRDEDPALTCWRTYDAHSGAVEARPWADGTPGSAQCEGHWIAEQARKAAAAAEHDDCVGHTQHHATCVKSPEEWADYQIRLTAYNQRVSERAAASGFRKKLIPYPTAPEVEGDRPLLLVTQILSVTPAPAASPHGQAPTPSPEAPGSMPASVCINASESECEGTVEDCPPLTGTETQPVFRCEKHWEQRLEEEAQRQEQAHRRNAVQAREKRQARMFVGACVLGFAALWSLIQYANSNNSEDGDKPRTAAEKCADAVPAYDQTGAYEACLEHYAEQSR